MATERKLIMRAKWFLILQRQLPKIFMLVAVSTGMAQSHRESLIGKPCPDYKFNNVHYFKTQSFFKPEIINVREFRGKWLFLDFWTRSCSACVKSFPNLNRLQKEFPDSLQFLLVGINDKYNWQIESYFAGAKAAMELDLPIAYDSTLARMLNIRYVPYLVMIDPHGIIRKIIPTRDVTKEKIEAILRGDED